MPNIRVALPETEQNIFRPIVLAVVDQVQKITNMKSTQILFPNEDNKVATTGGSIDSKNQGYVETTNKRHNEITVEEEPDTGEISPTFLNGKEYPTVFEDRRLGVSISPVYAKHNVTILFKYQCNSKNEATRWLQDMRVRLAQLVNINVHSCEYHYNLHTDCMAILKKIHQLRETQGAYGQTFQEYFTEHSTNRLTFIGDLAGKNAIMAVAEKQTNIYGQYDFDALPPKPEKNNETGAWTIGFGYRFNYDKPINTHMRYPIIVHNLPMPLSWISFTADETREESKGPVSLSRTQNAMRIFRADTAMDRIKSSEGIISIPRFDDFVAKNYLTFTTGMLLANVGITLQDKRTLLSLTDLGDIVLDDDLLTFLKESEWPYLCKPSKSIFNLSLYQNDSLQTYDRITINSDLLISAVHDLSIRNQYHLRLSIVSDLCFIDRDAITRLCNYPKVVYKLTAAINRAFRENPEMVRLALKPSLSLREFKGLYQGVYNLDPRYYSSCGTGWGFGNELCDNGLDMDTMRRLSTTDKRQRNVMIFGVLAYHKNDPELKTVTANNIQIAPDC